jgi:arylsulfatase A-like enzyme
MGLVVVCLCASACDRGRTPATSSPVLRFIGEPPQEVFESRRIAIERTAVELSPNPATADGGWRLEGVATAEGWPKGRLQVRSAGGGELSFTRDLEAPASSVDVVEAELGGLRPSDSVRLRWAGADEEFSQPASLRLGARLGAGAAVRTFRFDVADYARWTADVTRLQIVVTTDAQLVQLGRVAGLRLELDRAGLERTLGGPWIAELGGHHRSALLTMPGVRVERRLVVPPGARLEFGTGIPPTQPVPVRFRVTVTNADEPGEAAVVLDVGGESTWRDHVVDLEVFAGREVTITLEVAAEGELEPLGGLPMWADPAVWAPSAEPAPPNVVLISIDTLRADRMSLYGYPRPTTPHLDRWAREKAVVFETAVAAAPWTLPSHVSMLTGIDAVGHGVNHAAPAPPSLLTLAEILRARGWTTVSVAGGSYLHPRFGLSQGFDDYRSYKGDLTLELETELEIALAWLEANAGKAPFFLFFHTYEVHDPYDPREPFLSDLTGAALDPAYRDAATRNAEGPRADRLRATNVFVLRDAEGDGATEVPWAEVGLVSDLYDSGVAYADDRLGRLLDRLTRRDLAGSTLVIVTSDHGEALGERELAGHGTLYDHDLLVPLMIALPGGERRVERVAAQVRLVDILPTVLDAVGLAPPPGLDGASLLPMMNGAEAEPRRATAYASMSNHGLALRTTDGMKYILRNLPWPVPAGREELYDLATDPAELDNLAVSSSDAAPLRSAVLKLLDDRQPGARLELSNRGERPCRVELGGRGVVFTKDTVKTIGIDGECDLVGTGALGCDLAAGTTTILVAERVEEPRVVVDGSVAFGSAARSQPFTLALEIGVDHGPRTVVVAGDGGEVTATLSWVGDPGLLGIDPAGIDDELRRQLEALGYVR